MKKTINCIIISKDWVTGFLGLEYKKVTGGGRAQFLNIYLLIYFI